MEDKPVQNINSIADIETLLSDLMELFYQSKKVLCRKTITRDQGREMAEHVTRIRLLITELCRAENKLLVNKADKEAIDTARENYFELEGLVKEIRNNLVEE